jgi:hypothetical protein
MTKKAPGLAAFMEWEDDQQFDVLHRDGVYIGKRKEGTQTVVLFQLYSFYVEIYYKHYRRLVDRTIATDNADILHPYIDQINVRDLDGNNEPD